VQDLGSPGRVLAIVNAVLAPPRLREIAAQHGIVVPGFRAEHAPLNLIARAIANQTQTDAKLRETVEGDLARIATRTRQELAARPETEGPGLVDKLAGLDPPEARSLLASMLLDERPPMRAAAVDAVDRLVAGTISLYPRPEPGGSAVPTGRGRHERRESGANAAEQSRQLAALRKETTRQDRTIRKLRDQLDAAKAKPPAAAPQPVSDSGDARLASDLMLARTSLDAALRDLATVAEGSRILSDVVGDGATDDEIVSRPTAPSALSTASAESKMKTVSASPIWPRDLNRSLRRLAGSPYVETLHVLGPTPGSLSRVVGFVDASHVLVQVSDGTRAARVLVETVAVTASARAWVRRHLGELGLDSTG
jgi:hypothetical protein